MNTLGKKKLGVIAGAVVLAAGVTLAGFQIATAETQPSTPISSVVPVSVTVVTPTPTVAPVVEVAVETVAPVVEPAPAPVVEPAPIKCPAGSTAESGEGMNDTSCIPDLCRTITLPDPAHPECDAPFKP